ncbi:MAG: molybdenum cofactor guanylyltransferase [Dehalococcoidales bacterium]|nr:molybdenum cofactor guanylyltransferase [Dehalococcoidales bacterium]
MVVAVSGAVLAGGKSTRMGADKAGLRVGDETLLGRVVARLAGVVEEVFVVGRVPTELPSSVRAVSDLRPGAGSLGGIFTALSFAQGSRCLVVACDMPFLNRRLLAYLLDLSPGYDVVIPRDDGNVEPLHAVYAKTCLEPIRVVLEEGGHRIVDFFPRVRVRYVEKQEIAVFDPELRSFFNVNTPAEFRQALAIEGNPEGGQDQC